MNTKDLTIKEQPGEFIARLRQGDETAMKHIFREYYSRLYYFSLKMIGNEADTEDIVQEAFLNFWINIREKDVSPENIQAYLYRMVRNRCVNYLQRQQMLDDRSGEVIEHFYNDCQRQMNTVAVQEELFHRVSREFAHLTPIQTQVMELLFVNGLSVAEVATQLKTTDNNVRNHKARALERLKTVVKTDIPSVIIFFLIFFKFL